MEYDVAIVGGGPAGLSAAVNVRARGKTCCVLTNATEQNPLYKTKVVDNYVGMRGVSGAEMLQKMHAEAEEAGVDFAYGRVLSILPFGGDFMLSQGTEIRQAHRVILATGVAAPKALEGEEALLGQGVSYCATCDGMLYRGKPVVVTGNASSLGEEAAFLQDIGVQVTVVTQKVRGDIPEGMPVLMAKKTAVEKSGEGLTFLADDHRIACAGVFILRDVLSAASLVTGLKMHGKFIKIDAAGRTNVDGVYAAGDCTGQPLQIAKAVGQGLIAGQHAANSIK